MRLAREERIISPYLAAPIGVAAPALATDGFAIPRNHVLGIMFMHDAGGGALVPYALAAQTIELYEYLPWGWASRYFPVVGNSNQINFRQRNTAAQSTTQGARFTLSDQATRACLVNATNTVNVYAVLYVMRSRLVSAVSV